MIGVNDNGSEAGNQTPSSLLERVRARDSPAWARLLTLYGPLVNYWCRRAGLQDADAADVGQEVFRSVARAIDTFRKDLPGATFRGWLRVITRNKLYDFVRKRRREPNALDRSPEEIAVEQWDSSDAEDAIDERRLVFRRAVEGILDRCEERTRQAFWRLVVEGQSAAEVSAALDLKPNAVYLIKSRILRRLRDELEGLMDPCS